MKTSTSTGTRRTTRCPLTPTLPTRSSPARARPQRCRQRSSHANRRRAPSSPHISWVRGPRRRLRVDRRVVHNIVRMLFRHPLPPHKPSIPSIPSSRRICSRERKMRPRLRLREKRRHQLRPQWRRRRAAVDPRAHRGTGSAAAPPHPQQRQLPRPNPFLALHERGSSSSSHARHATSHREVEEASPPLMAASPAAMRSTPLPPLPPRPSESRL